MRFDRAYHRWNVTHAIVLSATALMALLVGPLIWSVAGLWTTTAILILYLLGRRLLAEGTGAVLPNMLTAVRAMTATVLFFGVAISSYFDLSIDDPATWAIAAALLAIELTDFFDGRIARRRGTCRFGSTWDMECDAVFTLALAATVKHIYTVGAYVLLIGAMRYLYVLLWRYDGDPPVCPRVYKLYAKTTAATIVVVMIASLAPIWAPRARTTMLLAVLGMQVLSFGWDIVLQRRV